MREDIMLPQTSNPSPGDQPLFNEAAAARFLGLQISTLRRWRWAGTGPAFLKLGSAVRYDPNDLQDYIEECRRRSTTPTPAEVMRDTA
jgi:hypothetical protein